MVEKIWGNIWRDCDIPPTPLNESEIHSNFALATSGEIQNLSREEDFYEKIFNRRI